MAEALSARVEAATPRLLARDPGDVARRPSPSRWSPIEIVGHLVDSAANNHQRFVRAREGVANDFPGYDQDAWVERQRYVTAEWRGLVTLWSRYNLHLAHVVAGLPHGVLASTCRVGGGGPVTVAWLVTDYLDHLRHHLRQLGVEEPVL